MRNDFEAAASSMIEVDPYRRLARNPTRNADISAISGRGSTGVDLRFHPKDKFLYLPQDQQQELRQWLRTKDGKKSKKEFFMKYSNDKGGDGESNKRNADNTQGKKLEEEIQEGFKGRQRFEDSHVHFGLRREKQHGIR